jgi:hypothetical protein
MKYVKRIYLVSRDNNYIDYVKEHRVGNCNTLGRHEKFKQIIV